MSSLIEEIQVRLTSLAAEGIAILPAIAFALVILLLTRTVANLVRRAVRKLANRTLKSLSLQSLLVQTQPCCRLGFWHPACLYYRFSRPRTR